MSETPSIPCPLTTAQQAAYLRDGCLLVSGLIPPEITAAADEEMWSLLGIRPTEPEGWAQVARGHQVIESPALVACYTDAFLAAATLLGDDEPAFFRAPKRAFCLNLFLQSGEWEWPRPHIDHAIKEHGHKTFPRAFRLATMTFLHDIATHGGGTVVWPGSHRRIEALARGDDGRFEYMWPLNQALGEIDLGVPVELTPRAGDVLFYHYLCAHAGSMNVSHRPRFAMNLKW